VDTAELAKAVSAISQQQNMMMSQFATIIAEQNDKIAAAMTATNKAIEMIAKQKPAKPIARPSEYDVIVNKEDGEQVSMRISAPRRH